MGIHQLVCVLDRSQKLDVNADRLTVVRADQDIAIAIADTVVQLLIFRQAGFAELVPARHLRIQRDVILVAQQYAQGAVRGNVTAA